MENNFICEDCKTQFFEPHYKIAIRGENTVYKQAGHSSLITCPNCKSESIKAIDKKGEYPIFAKFASKTNQEKANTLKQRAKKNASKPDQVEQRKSIDKDFKKKFGL